MEKHKNQLYGIYPFIKHPEDVAKSAIEFDSANTDLVICAFLHDVLEDTSTSKEELEGIFGKQIADIVYRVSDDTSLPKDARKSETYKKIAGHKQATILKLLDRISNVNEGVLSGSLKTIKYIKQMPEFEAALFVPGMCDNLWNKLKTMLKLYENLYLIEISHNCLT